MKINIPDGLIGKQLDAYMDVVNKLIENPEIDTLFFSGSFYHGGSSVNSDLDFIAITFAKFDYFQRIQDVSNKVFYEVFIYSEAQLKRSFELVDYQDMHMVGYGFLVFSKSENFQAIKLLAKSLFERGPSKISGKQFEYEKYLLWDRYADILDILEVDGGLSKSLMYLLLWDSLRVLYIDKCIWFPKKKRILESLIKVDKAMFDLVNEFLNTDLDNGYLSEIIKKIIERVIYPSKSSEPFIWQSEKKIL